MWQPLLPLLPARGEKVGMRGGTNGRRLRMPPPLTLTLSP